MKKFFQRLDNSSAHRGDYQREGSATAHGISFIGKVFTVGQFQCTVEDTIAEGGFALVFLVKTQTGARYALKKLHVNNEHDLEICKREIDIMRKLGSHKNIVQLIESTINYAANGVYEILVLMQYCRGHLLQLMNDHLPGGFTEPDLIRILCDLCEAIARLHQSEPPIIHRDLKVENILIGENGQYLLCDFGSATTKVWVAGEVGHPTAMAIEEEIKRYTTLAYRAPEMVDVYAGSPITTKADIWALGCLIYKIAFFSLPFGESTLAIQNAQLAIPDDASERYSDRLMALIGYMLRADPNERPDIFQVAALAFDLAGGNDGECPVKNVNGVKVPIWSSLPLPPTETNNREVCSARTQQRSSNMTTAAADKLDTTTTSVVPRQRPKASIPINSMLPTSPVAFQRPTTPTMSGENAPAATTTTTSLKITTTTTSTLTLSVNTVAGGGATMSNSHSFTQMQTTDGALMTTTTTAAADTGSKQSKQFASNPQLSSRVFEDNFSASSDRATSSTTNNAEVGAVTSSKNPFISFIPTLPGPPQSHSSSSRKTQTPPSGSAGNLFYNGDIAGGKSSLPVAQHFHHRRNMSDTSTFGSRNVSITAAASGGSDPENGRQQQQQQQKQHPPVIVPHHQRVRSLNPFEDPNYEDQLFGHEFDKIRSENAKSADADKLFTSLGPDPFGSVPFDREKIQRYVDSSRRLSDQTTPLGDQPPPPTITTTTKPSGGTVITIGENNHYTISNNLAVGNNSKADKSISSSSQGQATLGPATHYMPLYSSGEEEESDGENGSAANDDDEDIEEDANGPEETPADFTKPLVDEEEEVESDGSSIGTASDLQKSDSDDEDDDDDEDDEDGDENIEDNDEDDEVNEEETKSASAGSGITGTANHVGGGDMVGKGNDSDDDDDEDFELVNFDESVPSSRFRYGRVKTSAGRKEAHDHRPAIARIKISAAAAAAVSDTASDNTSLSINEADETGQPNKSGDTIDHLIGHIEGHRPLLDDDEEEEAEPASASSAIAAPIPVIRPFIQMDTPPVQSPQEESAPPPPPTLSFNLGNAEAVLFTSSDGINTNTFEAFTLQQIIDETEENLRLDQEVERSLTAQVIRDQMNHKDLFGSIPFTDKDLMDKTTITLDKTKKTGEVLTPPEPQSAASVQFETNFDEQKPSPVQFKPVSKGPESMPKASTDLFGSVPFSAQKPQPSTTHSVVVVNSTSTPVSTKTSTVPSIQLQHPPKKPIAAPKPVLGLQGLVKQHQPKKVITTTTVPITVEPEAVTAVAVGMVSKNQVTNPKIKSKLAKKYEVDLDVDDDADGLLGDEPDDELGDEKGKKKKKDKKEKEKKETKKLKEKEDKKKAKVVKNVEKVKEKEKTKETKEKAKELKEKTKETKDKAKKTKKADKTEAEDKKKKKAATTTTSTSAATTSTTAAAVSTAPSKPTTITVATSKLSKLTSSLTSSSDAADNTSTAAAAASSAKPAKSVVTAGKVKGTKKQDKSMGTGDSVVTSANSVVIIKGKQSTAFANMSFEDEGHQGGGQQAQPNGPNSVVGKSHVTTTKC